MHKVGFPSPDDWFPDRNLSKLFEELAQASKAFQNMRAFQDAFTSGL
jgi:hypothetical protein